ncbi:MAG: hypothetical protein BWY72_01821 [Bacteroidetes bacterium ADurb.Bin416]|nr:MAG: hypothetical protein BWY72_01821 [Bacteroidetes bacterium ADurb.Bin416]
MADPGVEQSKRIGFLDLRFRRVFAVIIYEETALIVANQRKLPVPRRVIQRSITGNRRQAGNLLADTGIGCSHPVGPLVDVGTLVEHQIQAQVKILHVRQHGRQFQPLHIGVVNVAPLIIIAHGRHCCIGIRKTNLIFQVGSEHVGRYTHPVTVIIGRKVDTDRTFRIQVGRFPDPGRTTAEVQVFRKTIGSPKTSTGVESQGQVVRHFVLNGQTGIHAGLIKGSLGKIFTGKHLTI